MNFPFDNTYARLPAHFFAPQIPAQVPEPRLIRLNTALAENLGLDVTALQSGKGAEIFSGNVLPGGAEPIALAYAGHQFGGWVPRLGDGRAILLGEIVARDGRRMDIQLKGAGRTPFSRGGDGKAALGPVLREYLVSEAMAALGVPTTRALAAVATGELVYRETPLPGAIFTRVAASHIRVGTFQYFHARDDRDALRTLAETAVARHYPAAADTKNPPLALLEAVIAAQAGLVAKWMGLGFIHGVMNTDNTAISGETIDYGPCAFMDTFHPHCVFSAIDRGARYAWGNQASIARWNLTRFAETLITLLADSQETALAHAQDALGKFPAIFQSSFLATFRAKLGLAGSPDEQSDTAFINETLGLLATHSVDFTLFFRQLTRHASGESAAPLAALFDDPAALDEWLILWKTHTSSQPDLPAMRSANPVIIPRNHRIEAAIQAGYNGDFAPFHRLADALATPYTESATTADLEQAPQPHEIVHQTFCGT